MADIGELRYDRSVTPEFALHFQTGGFAESLVDYARGKYPIDFQYRKDPKTGRQWATLYVGLTAVLNVLDKKQQGLALSAHATYRLRQLGWSDEWAAAAPVTTWAHRWGQVETYLERVIAKVVRDGKFITTEGIVQASVAGYLNQAERAVIDREVAPHFRDQQAKSEVQGRFSQQLMSAIARREPAKGLPKGQFGMECDALAIDRTGNLVAIEIKPGNVSTLVWVAAQATMYAKVLQHWLDRDDAWLGAIERSFRQRELLGLTPPNFTLPKLTRRVVPAVAFQRVASGELVQRMYAVQDALLADGVGSPDLTFYAVAPSGRLDRHQRS